MRKKGIAGLPSTPKRIWCGGLGAVMFFIILSYSQAQQERTVKEIAGEGFRIQRFDNFKSRIESREGKPFSDETADKDVKRLFSTGLFDKVGYKVEDVSGQPNMVRMVFIVEEYKIITDMEAIGIKTKDREDIEKALRLRKGDTLNPHLLKLDGDYIREQYLKDGYAFIKVEAETEEKEGGIILRWLVREGPKVTVDSIEFSGNDHIKASRIRDVMQTQEDGWFSSAPFSEAGLANDIDRIKVFYLMEGFPDIAKEGMVFLEDISYNSDKTKVTIKIHVTEGERYKVDKIRFEGITLFDEQILKKSLKLKEGDYFSEGTLQKDAELVKGKYGERSYIDSEVNPQEIYHEKERTLDVVFKVIENEPVRVGKIIIKGNTKTRDDVIRQRIKVYPGEPYDTKQLDRSIARLRDTRWFKRDIKYESSEGEEPGTKDLTVTVDEAQTGSIRFAAGYNTAYGIVGLISLNQSNFDLRNTPQHFSDMWTGKAFSGGGQDFTISASPGKRFSSYQANFYEPYLWGYNYGGGLSGFKYDILRETYAENKTGAAINLDKKWDNFERLVTALTLDYAVYDINNISAGSPFDVTSIAGGNREMSLIPKVRYDTLDSTTMPSEGYFGELQVQYSTGSFDYTRAELRGGYYKTLLTTEEKHKHVFGVRLELSGADTMRGSQLPIYARYFAGGVGSIRGFAFRGIGPRSGNQPLGGGAYAYLPLEYSFPLWGDIFRGVLFYDFADLDNKFSHFGSSTIRMATGLGFRITIPQLGSAPMAVYFGYPTKKLAEDQKQFVTVDVGILF